MRDRLRGALLFALRLAVSGGILAYLWFQFGGAEAERQLLASSLTGFVSVTAIIALQLVLTTVRWTLIMRPMGISIRFGAALRIFFISNWFNQALPSMVGGDAVRVWLIRRAGTDWRLAAKAVIIDRLVALSAILLLIALTYPVFWTLSHHAGARTTVALLLGVGLTGLGAAVVFDALPTRLRRYSVFGALAGLARALRIVLFDARLSPVLLALAIAIHALMVLAVYVLVQLAGASLSPVAALAFVPPVILLSAVPVSIGSWGVREGAMIASLSLVGIEPALALSVSIQIGLALMVNGLVGGVLWLLEPGHGKLKRPA